MQSAYALRICIADTDHGSVRMEMYTNRNSTISKIQLFVILYNFFAHPLMTAMYQNGSRT